MVVLQRNEIGRNRLLCFLTIILGAAAIVAAFMLYFSSSQTIQAVLLILAAAGLGGLLLSLIQLYGFPRRSQVLLLQGTDEMIIATNANHEGFKLRYLRDILSENTVNLTDEDRARWKPLEADGFHAELRIRNPKKLLILRLCTMVFDDVYAVDFTNRWEHHECANTSEPTFANGDAPQLSGWKQFRA